MPGSIGNFGRPAIHDALLLAALVFAVALLATTRGSVSLRAIVGGGDAARAECIAGKLLSVVDVDIDDVIAVRGVTFRKRIILNLSY